MREHLRQYTGRERNGDRTPFGQRRRVQRGHQSPRRLERALLDQLGLERIVRFDDDSAGGPSCTPTYVDDCNFAADGMDAAPVPALRMQTAFTFFLVAKSARSCPPTGFARSGAREAMWFSNVHSKEER